jgi:orotidine-5'-phosphate decarboxylase
MTPSSFGDRLAAAVAERESQIVLGIDPHPERLWPLPAGATEDVQRRLSATLAAAREAAAALIADTAPGASGATRPEQEVRAATPAPEAPADLAAAATLAHCVALIDAAGPACVAVKPQIACFERLGAGGWLVLEAVAAHARAHGLLVIADGKRGDVPVTATAYAQALLTEVASPFGTVSGLRADALTVNPLLGRDALEPLVTAARATGAGLFLLVRTSNPGAGDVMDLPLQDGRPLWERLAALARELGDGAGDGLADVGAVTGATAPEHLARMRDLMPRTPFLLPGVGAQGGDVAALGPAFAPGPAGGLVTASRSIAEAHLSGGGQPGEAARAEAERLRAVAWGLARG